MLHPYLVAGGTYRYRIGNALVPTAYTLSRMATTHTRVPDSVREKAKDVKSEYDYPSIGEAIRHMCQEGGYDV
jgi:hypothetical protein